MLGILQSRSKQPSPEGAAEDPAQKVNRFLTMMIEGAARTMPEVDPEAHKKLVATVNGIALQTPDRLPDADKLVQIQIILRELELYGRGIEEAIRGRQYEWRILAATLLRELEERLGFDASEMELRLGDLETAEELQEFRHLLSDFLHPESNNPDHDNGLTFHTADRTTDNTNAAGLRGGGVAVQHAKRIMDRKGRGHAVLIRLGCLEMINERFGPEAVQDCLMAVSAFLTARLRREDQIYHWTDSMLLAIVEDRANEKILAAELSRITSQNREITVTIGGRMVMLRIPLEFDITPIRRLNEPDDLFKLTMGEMKVW